MVLRTEKAQNGTIKEASVGIKAISSCLIINKNLQVKSASRLITLFIGARNETEKHKLRND